MIIPTVGFMTGPAVENLVLAELLDKPDKPENGAQKGRGNWGNWGFHDLEKVAGVAKAARKRSGPAPGAEKNFANTFCGSKNPDEPHFQIEVIC